METKKCPKCGEVKPASDFGKDLGTKSGLKSWCKDCDSTRQKQRYHKKRLALQKDGN